MSEQPYFWTLSALLQGFAALIALAGVFAIYRLRKNTEEIHAKIEQLRHVYRHTFPISHYWRIGHRNAQPYIRMLRDYCERLRTGLQEGERNRGSRRDTEKEMERAQHHIRDLDQMTLTKRRILSWTKRVTLSCGCVVLVTMSGLAFGSHIHPPIREWVAFGAWGIATFALCLTIWAIIAMLKEPGGKSLANGPNGRAGEPTGNGGSLSGNNQLHEGKGRGLVVFRVILACGAVGTLFMAGWIWRSVGLQTRQLTVHTWEIEAKYRPMVYWSADSYKGNIVGDTARLELYLRNYGPVAAKDLVCITHFSAQESLSVLVAKSPRVQGLLPPESEVEISKRVAHDSLRTKPFLVFFIQYASAIYPQERQMPMGHYTLMGIARLDAVGPEILWKWIDGDEYTVARIRDGDTLVWKKDRFNVRRDGKSKINPSSY